MDKAAARTRVLVSTLAGAALGFFVFHPYTMLVYGAYNRPHVHLPVTWHGHVSMHLMDALGTFQPGMLHMGIPYLAMGGVTGALYGLWLNARIRWEEVQLRACATDTIEQLMVTLSHYLLNSATIIAGYAARAGRKTDDGAVKAELEVIRRQAERVEAVVKSLQSVQEVVSESYTKDSETRILDITEEMKKRMEQESIKAPGVEGPS
jgi:signal transduction histidine kinase